MSRYKYLLWDIDGTVLDFLAAEDYAIKSLFKKYSLGVCTDEMISVYSEINVKYWQKLERGELTKPEVLVGRFVEFFGLYGLDTSVVESFNRDYQLELGEHIVFVDYAREMLEAEKGNYVLVAVTNGTKAAQTKKLTLSGLFEVFDYVFISEDVGFEKPSQSFFDVVFKEVGITDKREVLLIGDSLTSDMKGGETAGVDTCWFNPKRKGNDKGVAVKYEIQSLKQIADVLNA